MGEPSAFCCCQLYYRATFTVLNYHSRKEWLSRDYGFVSCRIDIFHGLGVLDGLGVLVGGMFVFVSRGVTEGWRVLLGIGVFVSLGVLEGFEVLVGFLVFVTLGVGVGPVVWVGPTVWVGWGVCVGTGVCVGWGLGVWVGAGV